MLLLSYGCECVVNVCVNLSHVCVYGLLFECCCCVFEDVLRACVHVFVSV